MCARREPDAHVVSQAAAGVVLEQEAARLEGLNTALRLQEGAFERALGALDEVRRFVGEPGAILGSPATKHGEIAEQVEVGVRRARDFLSQQAPRATFEGVGRTAPADYLVEGVEVQSKFINGVGRGLDHVLGHMRKYEHFGRDGSFYHLPKDQHAIIEKILAGEHPEGLRLRTVRAIEAKLAEIDRLSQGRGAAQLLKPAISDYGDVQLGKVDETIEGHERALRGAQEASNERISAQHALDWGDVAGASLKGAALGAGLRLTLAFGRKIVEGKNPLRGDFSLEDWQAVGLEAGEGALQGGVTTGAVYALTNFSRLSAPLAGAYVGMAASVTALANQWRRGELDFDEFVALGQLACLEGSLVYAAATAGQALIPVPILGAVVGGLAGRAFAALGRALLGQHAEAIEARLFSEHEAAVAAMDASQRQALDEVMAHFESLKVLTEVAFDPHLNSALRLKMSVELARAHGVKEEAIIHDLDELDDFMTS